MISIGFTGLGLLFMIIGIVRNANQKYIKKNGTKTKAEIIDFKTSTSYSNNSNGFSTKKTYYYPILKFKNKKGEEIIHTQSSGTSYKLNQSIIDIYYLREKGKYRIFIDGIVQNKILIISFIVFGSIFAFVGIIGLFFKLLVFGF